MTDVLFVDASLEESQTEIAYPYQFQNSVLPSLFTHIFTGNEN